MLIDQLAYNNRFRKIHPVEKVSFVALCIFASLLANSLVIPSSISVVVTFFALVLARIPYVQWFRICLIPVGFLFVAGITLALEIGNQNGRLFYKIYEQLYIGVTDHSIFVAIKTSARSFACLIAMLFLAATTPTTDLVHLMRKCKVPSIMIEMFSITYRSIFILIETSVQMQQAQASRLGYSNSKNSIKSLGMLAARLFSRSLERADMSWRAVLSRGYEHGFVLLEPEYNVSYLRLIFGISIGLGFIAFAVLLPGGKG